MKKMKTSAALIAIAAAAIAANVLAQVDDAGPIAFSPAKGVRAELRVKDHAVELDLVNEGESATETIAVETEKKLRVRIEDYNFDGHKDFSISHTDDGMGTYEVSQVYVYSPRERKFVPLAPRCGDEFINLALNKSRKTLTNSYMVDNKYRTCQARY